MAIVIGAHARTSAPESRTFEGIREVVAIGAARSRRDGPHDRHALNRRMARARISCQKGREKFSAEECIRCERFVNCLPSGNSITVRCLWRECDPVCAVMTTASALVTVQASDPVSVADDLALTHGLRHLVVLRDSRMVGVVCRCDLLAPPQRGETVGDRTNPCPWVVDSGASLAQAAALMADRQLGCLPVIRDREVCGVITRGDLMRLGVETDLVGESRCPARVTPQPVMAAVAR